MITGSNISPFARPLYVMLKPVGAACNLRCSYCYYLDKKNLYPESTSYLLSDALLEKFTKDYLESQTTQQVLFTWHGGEALLRNIAFYKKALALQKRYGRGIQIDNCIQTNGTLLTDDWCRFLKENRFLVGISIDGPEHCHDRYRRGINGDASFHQVMKGVELLRKHDVKYNAMAVVNDYNVDYPLEFYRFFKSIDCRYIQFSPIVERINDSMAPWSVPASKWGDFLIAVFDEWVKQDVGQFYVQYFDSTLANWMGMDPGTCILAKYCGHAGVMEFNGDVYGCDHFVFPSYKLGNINRKTLTEMMYSPEQKQFGRDKYARLPRQCKECDVLFVCHGECPKNRIIRTKDEEEGLNYLCEGYYAFYKYVTPYMAFMKRELEARRSPANIMQFLQLNNNGFNNKNRRI
ncbi:MAG: Anaerobic sulfatase-maturating enzyme [Candidatus Ordinivivax streblomastigis]|uniref:Anaerobic sulfatase-maturating enzyme n=1 Tax=Candidatus Ordinivivax streblomastigis TaxID=2540710 RepID=A0A5M8P3E9_9BACT|nr:MAG: Anaerobic sulfatase-maturating enzyme [Candidatus Ordinivivax streblomastigis]